MESRLPDRQSPGPFNHSVFRNGQHRAVVHPAAKHRACSTGNRSFLLRRHPDHIAGAGLWRQHEYGHCGDAVSAAGADNFRSDPRRQLLAVCVSKQRCRSGGVSSQACGEAVFSGESDNRFRPAVTDDQPAESRGGLRAVFSNRLLPGTRRHPLRAAGHAALRSGKSRTTDGGTLADVAVGGTPDFKTARHHRRRLPGTLRSLLGRSATFPYRDQSHPVLSGRQSRRAGLQLAGRKHQRHRADRRHRSIFRERPLSV